MRFTDIAYSIPTLPLLIVLSSFSNSAVLMMVMIIRILSLDADRAGGAGFGPVGERKRMRRGRAHDRSP